MSAPALSIGDFARATHVSVKMLRHYHRIGLLEPADVDAHTGYRRYTTEQIPVAQVIRRFRNLDMPLDRIQAVLAAPDLESRNALIAEHLGDLQVQLAQTQSAVASLRDLLEHPTATGAAEAADVNHRRVEATPAAAIGAVIDMAEAQPWFQGALGELYATLAGQDVAPVGPAGGIFADGLFTHERGEATMFVPVGAAVRPVGRVTELVVPAVELATTLHEGSHEGIDRAYGALATHVAGHALAVDGPIREYYLVGRHETPDPAAWRTEIGWPIFHTGPATPPGPE